MTTEKLRHAIAVITHVVPDAKRCTSPTEDGSRCEHWKTPFDTAGLLCGVHLRMAKRKERKAEGR